MTLKKIQGASKAANASHVLRELNKHFTLMIVKHYSDTSWLATLSTLSSTIPIVLSAEKTKEPLSSP